MAKSLKIRTEIKTRKTIVVEESIKIIVETAENTNCKCFMLSFNRPDYRKYKINDIIAELLKNGYLHGGNTVHVLSCSILFLSSYNLRPLEKFIHSKFTDLKFVLVRLNRTSFPSLKYCY